MRQDLADLVEEVGDELVKLRRELHADPEFSSRESTARPPASPPRSAALSSRFVKALVGPA